MNDVLGVLLAFVIGFGGAYAVAEIVPWSWRALRRWRERREQEWLSLDIWAHQAGPAVSNYWALAGYKDAPGLRCMGQLQDVPNKVQRWLLRDIKALGSQGAWNKHGQKAMTTTSYTLAFINRSLGLPAGDTQLLATVDAALAAGKSAGDCLVRCRIALGVQGGGLMGPSQQTTMRHALALMHARPPQPTIASTAAPVLRNAYNQLYGLTGAAPGTGSQGPQPIPIAPTPARAADPVTDPYLAADGFAADLAAHLHLDDAAVAALPVRAYMLYVSLRAAQKDGEPWADMDRALHQIAGVAYVEAATP